MYMRLRPPKHPAISALLPIFYASPCLVASTLTLLAGPSQWREYAYHLQTRGKTTPHAVLRKKEVTKKLEEMEMPGISKVESHDMPIPLMQLKRIEKEKKHMERIARKAEMERERETERREQDADISRQLILGEKRVKAEMEKPRLKRNIVLMRRMMLQRPPTLLSDYLSPTHSNLTEAMLMGRMGTPGPVPEKGKHEVREMGPYLGHAMKPLSPPGPMPLGHHLVYFPPHNLPSELMEDGTLPEHHPGLPFGRRMWAGGKVVFEPGWQEKMRLDGRRAVCVEKVEDVRWAFRESDGGGEPQKDKLFVDVVRRYGPARSKAVEGGYVEQEVVKTPCITETRTLVFMREVQENDWKGNASIWAQDDSNAEVDAREQMEEVASATEEQGRGGQDRHELSEMVDQVARLRRESERLQKAVRGKALKLEQQMVRHRISYFNSFSRAGYVAPNPADGSFSAVKTTSTNTAEVVFTQTPIPLEEKDTSKIPPKTIPKKKENDPLTISQPFKPTRKDLFHFSALSYNAHSIHLDQKSAESEGYPNLLVQGPMTLLLMLRLVAPHCERRVYRVDYRNLAPLEAGKEMTICAKPFRRVPEERGPLETGAEEAVEIGIEELLKKKKKKKKVETKGAIVGGNGREAGLDGKTLLEELNNAIEASGIKDNAEAVLGASSSPSSLEPATVNSKSTQPQQPPGTASTDTTAATMASAESSSIPSSSNTNGKKKNNSKPSPLDEPQHQYQNGAYVPTSDTLTIWIRRDDGRTAARGTIELLPQSILPRIEELSAQESRIRELVVKRNFRWFVGDAPKGGKGFTIRKYFADAAGKRVG